MKEEIKKIINGHNDNINKIEPLVSEKLSEMINACQGKNGEELAGVMNFYWMDIISLVRKAGAIGYSEALHDQKDDL